MKWTGFHPEIMISSEYVILENLLRYSLANHAEGYVFFETNNSKSIQLMVDKKIRVIMNVEPVERN